MTPWRAIPWPILSPICSSNASVDWGVDTIFGFPGDGINGIFEALRTRQDEIRFIQVRHEEAAAFAACGYAKYTGRLGVCLATSGPGGIHLLNGLYDAKCDGQPVLAITGHTFHDLIGTHYQQDVDLDKLFMDVAGLQRARHGPAHVVNVVDEAIKTALAPAHRRAHHHPEGHSGVDGVRRTSAPRPTSPKHSADLYAADVARCRRSDELQRGGRDHQRRHEGRHPGRPRLPAAPATKCSRWREQVGGPDRQAAARQGGRARRQPVHHRRHRPARHRARRRTRCRNATR